MSEAQKERTLVERVEWIDIGVSNCAAGKTALGFNEMDMKNLARIVLTNWPHIAAEITSLRQQVETLTKERDTWHNRALSAGRVVERLATEERLAEMLALLDSCPCPRPFNDDPADTTIGQCNAMAHCGCVYASAIRSQGDSDVR